MSQNSPSGWKENKKTSRYKARLGLIMFFIYVVIYGGFILINVTYPRLMKLDVGNLNLAIVYGFALIFIAIILAVIYNILCSRAEKKADESKGDDEK